MKPIPKINVRAEKWAEWVATKNAMGRVWFRPFSKEEIEKAVQL